MHRCPECDEPCDCHEILLGGCIHCELDDYDYDEEVEEVDEDDL